MQSESLQLLLVLLPWFLHTLHAIDVSKRIALCLGKKKKKSLKKISQQMHRSRHNKTHTEFTWMELDSHFVVVVVVQGEMLLWIIWLMHRVSFCHQPTNHHHYNLHDTQVHLPSEQETRKFHNSNFYRDPSGLSINNNNQMVAWIKY